jgi:outer membrane protein TolC
MIFVAFFSNEQSNFSDSLKLANIIRQVIGNYPSIKKAEQDIEAANARIGLAKSAKLPFINASASYTRIAPVVSLTIPSMGTFEMNPANNYNAGINYNQMIYDFGKTADKVELENQNKKLSELSINQLKQQLSLSLLNNFYSILYLQEAIKIKNDEIKTLGEHLNFVEKLAATGSATQYVILSTKVRIFKHRKSKSRFANFASGTSNAVKFFYGKCAGNAINSEIGIVDARSSRIE